MDPVSLPPNLLSNIGELAGGLGGATVLFFAGRWMRRLNVVGRALSMAGIFATMLAVLIALGWIDPNLDAITHSLGAAGRALARYT